MPMCFDSYSQARMRPPYALTADPAVEFSSAIGTPGRRFLRGRLATCQQQRLSLLRALFFPEQAPAALADFTLRTWSSQLQWLDTSGLALYLYGSLCDHGRQALLPSPVNQRWHQNLFDNRARMTQLADEATGLHLGFQREHLRYATLKGFSLFPHSVPRMERRSQLDLDFLIAEEDANTARDLLESKGYTLRAISGRSWEFKKSENANMTLRDIYKPLPYRSVELHLEYASSKSPLLPRLVLQRWRSLEMPVLHPVDLLLGQGLHLFKHISSEFFRVAHLYEFRNNVVSHSNDDAFWRELREAAGEDARVRNGLGIVIAVCTCVTGSFAPVSLTAWTSDCLSAGLQRWVDEFALRVTLGDHPGSKLYLLLQQELAAQSVAPRRTLLQSLLPKALPPLITAPKASETLRERISRNRRQLAFILFRLRFHVVEGARYLFHARRWRSHRSMAEKTTKG
jgi:hypothetical protein